MAKNSGFLHNYSNFQRQQRSHTSKIDKRNNRDLIDLDESEESIQYLPMHQRFKKLFDVDEKKLPEEIYCPESTKMQENINKSKIFQPKSNYCYIIIQNLSLE